MIKVCFITHYSQLYGANRSLLNLIEGLSKFPVKSMVVLPESGELQISLEQLEIPCRVISFRRHMSKKHLSGRFYHKWQQWFKFWLGAKRDEAFNRSTVNDFGKLVSDWNPDIIFSNSSVINIGQVVADRFGLPHVWCWRERALEHYGYTLHISKNRLRKQIENATSIVAVSNSMRTYVVNKCKTANVSVIYNGIFSEEDCNFFLEKAKGMNAVSKGDSEFVFGLIGLIHPEKGIEDALEAAKMIGNQANFKIFIVGNGNENYVKRLKSWVKENDMDGQIVFKGYIQDIRSIYDSIDALLMCSRNEGMGRVTAEAMAFGRPVLGYRSGATVELIQDQVTGYLYDSGPKELSKLMLKLINERSNNPILGVNGNAWVLENCTIEVNSKKMYKLFSDIMEARNART